MQNDLITPQPPAQGHAADVFPAQPASTFSDMAPQPASPALSNPEPYREEPAPIPVSFGSAHAETSPNIDRIPAVSNDQPVPVVKVLSVRGVEYLFMSIMLWISAGSLVVLILSLLNGGTGFSVLAFPLSLLLVCLPGFALLFLRLKRAELANPELRFDPSKRRLTQITQVLAFLTCLINIITFVYLLLQQFGGEGELDLGKAAINMIVILGVAGGLLVYYWHDEHRTRR